MMPDERRLTFINAIVGFGEKILEASVEELKSFENEFIADPNRFRCELLGKTALARKALTASEACQLDLIGIEPDLLSPLQQLRKETSHTRVLAWALTPSSRSLGHAALKAFVDRVDLIRKDMKRPDVEVDEASWDLAGAKVRAEHHLPGYGRADLSIDLPNAFILVEVKIDAKEREGQIKDYWEAAKKNAGTRTPVVVYLTADPEDKRTEFAICLTFEQLLRDWLPVAAAFASAEHRYLASYLASVARVLGLADAAGFDDWSFARRRKAIDFIKTKEFE